MPTVECPKCAKGLRIQPAAIGKKVKCPGCGSRFQVPGEDEDEERADFDFSEPEKDGGSTSRSGKRKRTRMPSWALALILIGGGILLILVVAGSLTISHMLQAETDKEDAARLKYLWNQIDAINAVDLNEFTAALEMPPDRFEAKTQALKTKYSLLRKPFFDEIDAILARHPTWTEDGPRK